MPRAIVAIIVGFFALGGFAVSRHHDSTIEPASFPSSADTSDAPISQATTAPYLYQPTTGDTGPGTNTYSFDESSPGGYEFEGTLRIGTPEHFTPGLTLGNVTAGAACTIDQQTDAVLPASLTITNNTNGFSAVVAAQFVLSGISGIEIVYNTGPSCQQNNFGLNSTASVAPGGSIENDFFIVLENYYSPDTPSGDSSVLDDATLQLVSATLPNDDNVSVTSLTGPGATSDSFTIPVGGASSSGGYGSSSPTTTSPDTTTSLPNTSTTTAGPYPVSGVNVAVRSQPSTDSSQVGTLNDGDTVTIVCTTIGTPVPERTSTATDDLWDMIQSPPGYVSDVFLDTGSNDSVAPSC
jgi:hypothetical protein